MGTVVHPCRVKSFQKAMPLNFCSKLVPLHQKCANKNWSIVCFPLQLLPRGMRRGDVSAGLCLLKYLVGYLYAFSYLVSVDESCSVSL
jgi:hypothetical protein